MVVAVDGTSGSGKSSTCRGVASDLGLAYLDTGAMFRAVTWWMLSQGIDVHDAAAVAARCDEPVLVSGTDPARPDHHRRRPATSRSRSAPTRSTPRSPRSAPCPRCGPGCSELQREIIAGHLEAGGIVVEGRDIGSVVWPQAQVKVYLTADPGARAARRALEAGRQRRRRHRGLAARARPHRLRAGHRSPRDGRRGRPPRHHDVHARGGRSPCWSAWSTRRAGWSSRPGAAGDAG